MTLDQAKISLLERLLQEKEGEHLEFKEWKAKDDFDLLCKYCCSLANEGGGRFVMGVTDKRPRLVVGTSAFAQPERTRKGLVDRLRLAIDFEEIHQSDVHELGDEMNEPNEKRFLDFPDRTPTLNRD